MGGTREQKPRPSALSNTHKQDDSDTIRVAPTSQHKRRATFTELDVAQAQNKRQRILKYVLIPCPARVKSPPTTTTSGLPQQRHADASNDETPTSRTSSKRSCRRKSAAIVSYAEEGFGELDNELPTTAKRSKKPIPLFDSGSEFGEDSQSEESDGQTRSTDLEESEDADAASEAEMSSDHDIPRKKKNKKTQLVTRATLQSKQAQNLNEHSSDKAIRGTTRMLSLLLRDREETRGLDTSLAPMFEIDEIFDDLTTKALSLGLGEALSHLSTRPLRAATMCSGTESPLLALEMIRDSLQPHSSLPLQIEHLFSAEIVPYKQAYIERNFKPPVIFRDITEIIASIDDNTLHATTAYGARVPIPMQIDLLVAGTSCVDFSKLNKHQKELDASTGGESSQTWYAVLKYVEKCRPSIVLLENVKNAAWNQMHEDYEKIEYEVAGAFVDTKDFYIPHTRQRGYMVCFDRRKLDANGAGKQWQSLMKAFRRPASSSVTDFLISGVVDRAKHASSNDEGCREVDWSQCEIRQMDYRQTMRLGNARPFTKWQESGTISVPENGSVSWYKRQSERVKDCIDCSVLRKALPKSGMYDARFKTRIWNLSQNIDRFKDAGAMGITGCITPSGTFFVSDACRILTPEETLKLQGLPLSKISFTTETQAEMQDLAGNAMSSTVVGCAILAALICGYPAIEQSAYETQNIVPATHPVLQTPHSVLHLNHTWRHQSVNIEEIAKTAKTAARACICEGARGKTDKTILQCADCSHTVCKACAGNPTHNYRNLLRKSVRSFPSDFEQSLRDCLPLQLKFESKGNKSDMQICPSSNANDLRYRPYFDAVNHALCSTYRFHQIRRTNQWTAEYHSNGARLDLIIQHERAEWRLFASPDKTLPVECEQRKLLEEPIARATNLDTFLSSKWEWRSPEEESYELRIDGMKEQVGSWWARCQMPDFKNHKVWDMMRISIEETTTAGVLPHLAGLYQYLPNCGTANDSLYKRRDSRPGKRPVYLFKDPTRTGPPDQDCFVFAHDKETLEYGETRPILGRIEPAWTPWCGAPTFNAAKLTVMTWKPVKIALENVDVAVSLSKNKAPQFNTCDAAELIATCTVSRHAMQGDLGNRVSKVDLDRKTLFTENAWLFEALRRHLPNEEWTRLGMSSTECACKTCVPLKPTLRWRLDGDGDSIKPYEDSSSAAEYERAIKARPDPIFFKTSMKHENHYLSLGINPVSLAHRARARFPTNIDIVDVSWRLQHRPKARTFTSKPFCLIPTSNIAPYEKDLDMGCRLFPKQQVVLSWMRSQEAGKDFILEDAEEASLDALKWSLEVRARAAITIRGGICADHPGFGKTITSLALIQSQLREQSTDAILSDLQTRQSQLHGMAGLIPTAATLIISPSSLVRQWLSEINEKLTYQANVISIIKVADLDKYTIADFQEAKIIVVNRKVLVDENYTERLATFAAVPGPSTTSGRSFGQWLGYACKQFPEHLNILQNSGVRRLKAHVNSCYKERIASEEFRATIPSRRLRGKDYGNEKNSTLKKIHLAPATASLRTESIDRPLFEMFYFNRLIADEFHDFDSKLYAATLAINADKRWGLSATPRMNDFYEIAQMAGLVGVPLQVGSLSTEVMKIKNIRALQKELTDFERFDIMRQMPSDTMHARIHEIDQKFLDSFVRQNIMDFAQLPFEDHLVPVSLDIDHQAAYAELSHHLNSQDMRIRKGKSGKKTDFEQRLVDAIADSQSAEEALSRNAVHYYRERNTTGKEGLKLLMILREEEIECTLKDLRDASKAVQRDSNAFFEKMVQTQIKDGVLGDGEVIAKVTKIIHETSNGKTLKSRAQAAGAPEDDYSAPSQKETKGMEKARALTADVNKLAKKLLVSTRSHRYVHNVRKVVENDFRTSEHCDSVACHTKNLTRQNVAVSVLCGHLVCADCYIHLRGKHDSQCPANSCGAAFHDFHLLWKEKLGEAEKTTTYGAKVDAVLDLLEAIRSRREQAILFVQYENQLNEVGQALKDRNIASTVVKDCLKAGEQIADFQRDPQCTVIVLNAYDEKAAGSNLQNANHVIFLSPLLRNTQYLYDSTMAQAIGRVRRHGQKRKIHVYRIIALDTIDVDILEHRERRRDALVEQSAPRIKSPKPSDNIEQLDEAKREATQLVRQHGRFSLQPRSWLAPGDAKTVSKRPADICQAKNMVTGWEDFSALVKFSRAYTEDDE